MEHSPEQQRRRRTGPSLRAFIEASHSAVRRAAGLVSRTSSPWLGAGLGREYASYSDAALRATLDRVRSPRGQDSGDETLRAVFGLVDEALRRRLGAWRAFDGKLDHDFLSPYREMARRIVASGPYRSQLGYYTDDSFLDGPKFELSLEPLLEELVADDDGRAIVTAMVYVEEKSRVEYGGQILLPAEFYRAVETRDIDGSLAFKATGEQLLAGALMYQGRVVEMNAGEGKTIAAAFPASAHVASGRRVHVITANDYLALRDAEWLTPVYESLGIRVQAVLGHMSDDERRDAYQADIVYGTVREFGFDFLRDNLRYSHRELVQPQLDVALVDEADQVLIDESRTPLVISGGATTSVRSVHKIGTVVREMVGRQGDTVSAGERRLHRADIGPREKRDLAAKLLMADPRSGTLLQLFALDEGLYGRARDAARAAAAGEEPHATLVDDLYYHVEIEHHLVTLTDRGQRFVEMRMGPLFDTTVLETQVRRIESDWDVPLDRRRKDIERHRRRLARQMGQMNQVHQSLRAHLLLRKDEDYVVADGEVVLVDQPTGRSRPDSRYQHGLQAALEAKEGLTVRAESEVLGQISVQGFIRRYESVAGMTGTALAAEDELRRSYGLRVAVVPPTSPSRRVDRPTRLYRSRKEKLRAVLDEVTLCRRVGRPVLVGTLTVGQSREVSQMLAGHGIEHQVLNAVNSAEEAQVVRSAGGFGAVTVATNMAGRGTDIVLEPGLDDRVLRAYSELADELLVAGAETVVLDCATAEDADVLAASMTAHGRMSPSRAGRGDGAGVALAVCRPGGGEDSDRRGETVRLEFGLGLHVIGTEMNDSSRIDQQLRGRGGRQGDIGSSRFILSLEDRALALQSLFHTAGGLEPGSGAATQRRLDRAQKWVEIEGESSREYIADYYRILEEQTLAYYRDRARTMDSASIHGTCVDLMGQQARRLVNRHFPPSMIGGYAARFDEMAEELWLDFAVDCRTLWGLGVDALARELGTLMTEQLEHARQNKGGGGFDAIERVTLLQTGDELWRDHLAHLEELLASTMLCSQGHRTSVAEYHFQSLEAYERFSEGVIDCFLPRLLAVAGSDQAAPSGSTETALFEDVQEILV